jgi:hypothetical protein
VILQRQKWTGAAEVVDALGGPAHIHGFGPAAYARAFPASSKDKAKDVAARPAPPLADAAHPVHGPCGEPGPAADLGREEAPQRAFEGQERAKPPPSPWREDAEERVAGTRGWCLNGTMKDDLVLTRNILRITDPWVREQLDIAGARWRRKQQARLLTDGVRHYKLWHFFDKHTFRVLQEASDMCFVPATGKLLSTKTRP